MRRCTSCSITCRRTCTWCCLPGPTRLCHWPVYVPATSSPRSGPGLRFLPEEAAQFLNETMQLELTAADVIALETRTEGWIAGLQLAALSLRDQADKHAFVTAFTGDDRYIMDYLLEEVLQRQSPEVQDFLFKTSILERLCEPLCEAVTGASGSRSMLISLEQANLFVVPLDNRRTWYRYHSLFADLCGVVYTRPLLRPIGKRCTAVHASGMKRKV